MEPEKEHLRVLLIELVLYVDSKGYNNAQIGEIFNRDRSFIKRLIDENKPKAAKK